MIGASLHGGDEARGGPCALYLGDALEVLRGMPDNSVDACVTSPPYWGLRDYGVRGQIGLEDTPKAYVERLVDVFREVRRVLKDEGTLWLNLGDSYAGSWGAQSRGSETPGSLEGGSMLSARQIAAHPKGQAGTGSLKKTPGLKSKDLIGIPWRVAFALQADGWYLRQDIIWHKPNPMPESVRDRCTKAHEYVFLLSKRERYFYDAEAVSEAAVGGWNESRFDDERDLAKHPNTGRGPRFGGSKYGDSEDPRHRNKSGNVYVGDGRRNRRSVWTIPPEPFKGAHFAVMPTALVEPCVKAGCPVGGTVLDPFSGSGTTGVVALALGRRYIGIELNPEYVRLATQRIAEQAPLFVGASIAGAQA